MFVVLVDFRFVSIISYSGEGENEVIPKFYWSKGDRISQVSLTVVLLATCSTQASTASVEKAIVQSSSSKLFAYVQIACMYCAIIGMPS